MASDWLGKLHQIIKKKFGKRQGDQLYSKYAHVFPENYKNEYQPNEALQDIEHIEKLCGDEVFCVNLCYIKSRSEHPLRIRVIQSPNPTPLSDILPILENFNLRTYNERLYRIDLDGQQHWISDLSVTFEGGDYDYATTKPLFEDAITNVYRMSAENDGFNKLILGSGLSWHDIVILRAYTKYLKQLGFRLTQNYIEDTFVKHPEITKNLINLFKTLHDPKQQKNSQTKAKHIKKHILKQLNQVHSLDEDQIVRRFIELIEATLRTNYFLDKEYLSLKFNSRRIPDMPIPTPMFEIFV